MEVKTYSTKLVKPSIPTHTTLRFHNISFTDELAPTIYVPLILYYSPPPKEVMNNQFDNMCDHLEVSISKTLSDFYPLAGRYVRKLSLINCSDQGIRYVVGKASVKLLEILEPEKGLESNIVNNFLPCEIGEADEVDDPMLSVKVTTFECGGLAIGMCFSHRLSDMGTMCNFISNWASQSKGEYEHKNEKHSPIFNSTIHFPQRGLPELDLQVPRSSVGVKNAVRRFLFKGDAIHDMRQNVGYDGSGSRKPSKVQLVVALLWKAFVRMDQANNGKSKASFLVQPIGLRDKIVPQLPTNSFGNFWGLATSKLGPGEGDKIDFQDFFGRLRDSIKKSARDCSKILTHGEEGHEIIVNPYLEANKNIVDCEVNFYLFTCWCKFSFYEADFGYGKPIWSSTGSLPVQNLVIMMDDHEGDGVEAWDHLDGKKMKELEQDSLIKVYAL